jgi:hypothetical protein
MSYVGAHDKVSLGIPAVSIPIAVIVGLIAGGIVGKSLRCMQVLKSETPRLPYL